MTTGNTSKDQLRNRNPYRVPDGYFSDLRNNIMSRITEERFGITDTVSTANTANMAKGGVWGGMKELAGLAGLAGAFGFMVLVAVAGFYFTGYRAQQREQRYVAMGEANDLMLGYTLHSEDVEELLYEEIGRDAEQIVEQEHFAQAVDEYIEVFGTGLLADNDAIY